MDVLLIGGGIMSATLGTYLQELEPNWSITMVERLDALAQEATGTPLPVRALFGWLRGEPQAVPGWSADLSALAAGRLSARRLMPLPTAELRVVLDPP